MAPGEAESRSAWFLLSGWTEIQCPDIGVPFSPISTAHSNLTVGYPVRFGLSCTNKPGERMLIRDTARDIGTLMFDVPLARGDVGGKTSLNAAVICTKISN